MEPTFEALGVALIAMALMQVLKQALPHLVCGKVMKRALIWILALGAAIGIAAWKGHWPPSFEEVSGHALTIILASEGAYRYLLTSWKSETCADTPDD